MAEQSNAPVPMDLCGPSVPSKHEEGREVASASNAIEDASCTERCVMSTNQMWKSLQRSYCDLDEFQVTWLIQQNQLFQIIPTGSNNEMEVLVLPPEIRMKQSKSGQLPSVKRSMGRTGCSWESR